MSAHRSPRPRVRPGPMFPVQPLTHLRATGWPRSYPGEERREIGATAVCPQQVIGPCPGKVCYAETSSFDMSGSVAERPTPFGGGVLLFSSQDLTPPLLLN